MCRAGHSVNVEVFHMEQPARKVQVLKKGNRLAVLAGDKHIEDMVVFLMYRKLQALLDNKREQLKT